MGHNQIDLLGVGPALPEGFKYQPDLLSPEEEQRILELVTQLPFQDFEFQGFLAKRRVVSYAWQYDFNERTLALVMEYDTGAAVGWHRDKAVFGDVIGLSLLSPARFRLQRKVGTTWERASLMLEPRSAYLLRGPSRTDWEHSIPGVDALRYSITFRTFREDR